MTPPQEENHLPKTQPIFRDGANSVNSSMGIIKLRIKKTNNLVPQQSERANYQHAILSLPHLICIICT